MEGKTPRDVKQFHFRFFRGPVTFFSVVLAAAGDEVIPRERSASTLGQNVIQRQHYLGRFTIDDSGGPFFRSAVLTEVSVSCVDVWTGQDRNPNRNFFVVPKPDHTRKQNRFVVSISWINFNPVILFANRRTLDQELDGVLRPSDTYRFVRSIEDQNGFVD